MTSLSYFVTLISMKRTFAYHYRLDLTDAQYQEFVRWAGCVRKIWNYFLGEVKKAEERYKAKEKAESEQAKLNAETSTEKTQDNSSSDKDTNKKAKSKTKPKKKAKSYKGYYHYASRLTRLKAKKKYAYLNDCPAQALQQTLRNLDKGFKRFFKKEAGHPVFKKKAKYKAIHFPQDYQLFPEANGKGVIRLPKMGYVRYIAHRPIHPDFEIKNVYVRERGGHFYLSLQGEINEPDLAERPSLRKVIGLDLGIKHFFTTNQLEWVKPLNKYQRQLTHLQSLQRQLTTKTKFSTNWIRLQRRIAKKHHHIANCRKNFNHQLSRYIADHYDAVFLEKLDIQAMLAKGGHKLNMQILDQGWYQFKTFLKYKMEWLNKAFVEVDPAYTSQACAFCGHTSRGNRPTQSQFRCLNCGFTANADYQASLNIARRGLTQLEKDDQSVIFQDLFRQATYQFVPINTSTKAVVKQQKKKRLTQLTLPQLGVS